MPEPVISQSAAAAEDGRRAVAHRAVGHIGRHRGPRRQLQVSCRRGHDVADVYEAEGLLVVVTTVGADAQANRELPAGQNGTRHRTYVDLIDGEGSGHPETLAASCSCGPHLLARSELVKALEQGEPQLLVD